MMNLSNKSILVAGGAGFISKHLVKKIMKENEVIVYDNFSRGNIDEVKFPENGNLTIVKADILDLSFSRRSMVGCDVVSSSCDM